MIPASSNYLLAVAVNKGFHNLQLQVRRGETIIMLFGDMYDKLRAKPADSHGDNIRVGDVSFDSAEEIEEGVVG